MINKILIANRGEIAVRILRACREMGIKGAVVYSDADRKAMHVRLADEALPIGAASPGESYLSIGKIIDAARNCGAEAIHPGYGFLSENAEFAQAVKEAGLIFVGPPAGAVEAMGDKGRARRHMQAAGVPVVPGFDTEADDAELVGRTSDIGFPLLIKAAAGGGGKGMRLVHAGDDLQAEIGAARREALNAFGDGSLILERYIPHARHIEIQVLADGLGSTIHLFERECSIQRRHQKIIEESPSPAISDELRTRMGDTAVLAAKSIGYTNAGTVEFLVDSASGEFYFLEMNTRLQVEHAVTELTTGLDLVQHQIRIAAGEKLDLCQEDICRRGWAIECRLYAEDPANNFLPATGRVLLFEEPRGPGVRCDTGYATGDEMTIHYDPLIAKIITYAENRPAVIHKMQTALQDTVLLGMDHNGQFLQDVIASKDFQAGKFHTAWVEGLYGDWRPVSCDLPDGVLLAAGLSDTISSHSINGSLGVSDKRSDPWEADRGYRTGQRQELH